MVSGKKTKGREVSEIKDGGFCLEHVSLRMAVVCFFRG
jgi:hypothetical protein